MLGVCNNALIHRPLLHGITPPPLFFPSNFQWTYLYFNEASLVPLIMINTDSLVEAEVPHDEEYSI